MKTFVIIKIVKEKNVISVDNFQIQAPPQRLFLLSSSREYYSNQATHTLKVQVEVKASLPNNDVIVFAFFILLNSDVSTSRSHKKTLLGIGINNCK